MLKELKLKYQHCADNNIFAKQLLDMHKAVHRRDVINS